MSELINTDSSRKNFRWQLLTTVSAASLFVVVSGPESRAAQEADRPTVWIELGGQLEAIEGTEETYVAPFIANNLNAHWNFISPLSARKPPHFSFGGEAKLSFIPADSDWIFSANVRYGRSNGKRNANQQTKSNFVVQTLKYAVNHGLGTVTLTRFNSAAVKYSTTHAVVDFVAGKDVGLGIFGRSVSSTFSAGIRIAQFAANSDVVLRSLPSHYLGRDVTIHISHQHHHTYYAHATAQRSFRGVGPSISWDGSAPFLGNHEAGEVTLDWGANVAALFGRQKARGMHETTGQYFLGTSFNGPKTHYARATPLNRSRSTVVPNLGGFAGLSVKYPDAKFSLGYRADFFFNAMDEGIDTRSSKTQGFYGPFATFSVGLGG